MKLVPQLLFLPEPDGVSEAYGLIERDYQHSLVHVDIVTELVSIFFI